MNVLGLQGARKCGHSIRALAAACLFLITAACGSEDSSPPSEYELTVSVGGPGSVNSTPAGISCTFVCSRTIPSGISCGNECKQNFSSGTVVTLLPAPALTNGVTFFGWSGACSGKNACTVTMDSAKQVGAGFSTTGL